VGSERTVGRFERIRTWHPSMRTNSLRASRPSTSAPGTVRVPKDTARSWLASLAWPVAVVYVVLFGMLDLGLETALSTSFQVVVRVAFVAVTAIGTAALLVYSDLDSLAERARACAAERRLEGVLLTLRELHQSPPLRLIAADRAEPSQGDSLSAREREVVALIAQGRTSREIGEALVISEKTAATHADHIRAKLGLRSRAEIVVWALGRGIPVGEVDGDENTY
jgi:DNA-binding CsgD family transcriptional regulator